MNVGLVWFVEFSLSFIEGDSGPLGRLDRLVGLSKQSFLFFFFLSFLHVAVLPVKCEDFAK